MTQDAKSPQPDWLAEHGGFLRRLASQLVADEHDREDLLQETWATVLTAQPESGWRPRNARAWLARVFRNRAANWRRDRSHREDRERLASTRTVGLEADGAGDVGRELDVQGRVLTQVKALREPYRSVIYLRYYRDMTPTAIAVELCVPVATVDTRLLRGRALLREQLTREFGDRRVWLTALIPLSQSNPLPMPIAPATASALSLGALSMKMKLTLAVALTVLALGVSQWSFSAEPIEPGRDDLALSQNPDLPEVRGDEPALGTTDSNRTPQQSQSPVEAQEPPLATPIADPEGIRLGGRLLDAREQPLANLRLRFTHDSAGPERDSPLVRTDANGRFEFLGLEGGGRVRLEEPGWTTLFEGSMPRSVLPGDQAETLVVGAAVQPVSLHIQDIDGHGLPGAQVELLHPSGFRSSFASNLESSAFMSRECTTDEEGRVRMDLPKLTGLLLKVKKDGFEQLEQEVGTATPVNPEVQEMTLVLRALSRDESTLVGRVIDAFGDPLSGACVELGRLGTRADDQGRFAFDLQARDPFERLGGGEPLPARLTASAGGWQPVSLDAQVDVYGNPTWPRVILLQLVDKPLSIAGRVVDQDGKAIEDAVVFLPMTHLTAGRTTIEAEMRGEDEDGSFLQSERTDASGSFEFGGLLNEPYTIAAFIEGDLLRGELHGVQAGASKVEIVIDRSRLWPEVHGRVVAASGEALAGVKVTPGMVTQTATGGTGEWSTSVDMGTVTTDEDGRFVLRDIPREHISLVIEHPEVLYVHGLEITSLDGEEDEAGNLVDCDVPVGLRMRFRVLLDNPEEADSFSILDGAGRRAPVFAQTANRYHDTGDHVILSEGASRQLFVGEEARTLVLLKNGREVRHQQLDLTWGVETILR